MNDPIWNEELSTRLADLWWSHSASAIAEIFAVDGYALTRNAIVGRIRRMGLRGKADEIRKQRRHAARCDQTKLIAPSAPVHGVSIVMLRATECHWPVAMDAAGIHLFCARRVRDGSPYCWEHNQMGIQRALKRTSLQTDNGQPR